MVAERISKADNGRERTNLSAFALYSREVGALPEPSLEHEQTIGKKVQAARSSLFAANLANESPELIAQREKELREAAWELAIPFLSLVIAIARRMDNYPMDIEERTTIGTIGLHKAAMGFEPERGLRFITIAWRRVTGEIIDAAREGEGQLIPLPRPEWNKRKAEDQQKQTEGGLYHNGESLSVKILPMEAPIIGNQTIGDVIVDSSPTPEEIVLQRDQMGDIYQAMHNLTKKEQLVLGYTHGMYNGREYTGRELSKQMRVSEARISRLKKDAYRKMRMALIP